MTSVSVCASSRSVLFVTGIEPGAIAGAGVAAAKIAGKALAENPKDRNELLRIAAESGALDPAARSLAKRVALKEHLKLKLWQPLGLLVGTRRDYFEFELEDEMAERMKDVPEEDIITPKGSVAGPAIQGLGYVVDEPELRAMYLNLIATASDKRIAESAHPSFSDVIRNLSGTEAQSLAGVVYRETHPIVEIRLNAATIEKPLDQGFTIHATNVLDWKQVTKAGLVQVAAPDHAMFVNNWVRLGLVTVDYLSTMVEASQYDWAQTAPLIVAAREKYDTEGLKRIECAHGLLRVTDFGRAFANTVMRPVSAQQQLPPPPSDSVDS